MSAPSGEMYITGRIATNITGYTIVPVVEIGLQPTHGNSIDPTNRNVVAIQVTGMGGSVKIFRR